jgi:hypothetical protein
MKISIGEIFRVAHTNKASETNTKYRSYLELTAGKHSSRADIQKGIWAYRAVIEPGTLFKRVPTLVLHSNPFKEGAVVTPWMDIVEPDAGYAIYNGDNRRSARAPLQTRGNALVVKLKSFYEDPALRRFAPPVLLFTQCEVGGNRKGYREFSGYGIPTEYRLVSQHEKSSDRYFTNLVVELALFGLEAENEEFDWAWIDARRDGGVTAPATLKYAPAAWRLWVNEGVTAVERCRRRIARQQVASPLQQRDYAESDQSLLSAIHKHFSKAHHVFEGLACLVAARVIGKGCQQGWVTRRSGDGGFDFVCRLDIGSEFSKVPIVVLGQAKCQRLSSGKDLARLVARLQRGWIGVFVTTGIFSRAAQEELHSDRYPVLLINGKRLAQEIRMILNSEGISLEELLKREQTWYESHIQPLEPERILNLNLCGAKLGSEMNDPPEPV